nr:MAG TPA: hypothetical protein [Caudoviricetes sp.]
MFLIYINCKKKEEHICQISQTVVKELMLS